eukprot:sb/3468654/
MAGHSYFKLLHSSTQLSIDWAKDGCLLFYKEQLPELYDYSSRAPRVNCSQALNCTDLVRELRCYLLTKTPENLLKFQFRFSELLAKTTKRSHLDLLLAMVVEFDAVEEFIKQILAFMMASFQIPLLNHLLENFNFSLCNDDTLPLLSEAVERSTNAEICCKFMAAIKTEKEEAESGENKGGELEITVIPEDGTLATVARNHWNKIEGSTWPCSNKRPFCRIRRKLWDTEGDSDSGTKGEVDVSTAETVKDGA